MQILKNCDGKTLVFGAIALLFSADSILRSFRSNVNFGAFIMYSITAALWGYAIFHKSIDAFCAAGIGRAMQIAFLVGLGITAALLCFLQANAANCPPKGKQSAIVVLGAGLRGEKPSLLLQLRLDKALEYYTQNPDCLLVVTGGQGPQEAIPEAVAMAQYLQEKGVPSGKILVEQKSTSTQENLRFAGQLLQQRGIAQTDPIVVVSNAFHCYRARLCAKGEGFTAVSSLAAKTPLSAVAPSYLREVFAVVYHWVFK